MGPADDLSLQSSQQPQQQIDLSESDDMTSRKSVIVTHNPVMLPISLSKKRKSAHCLADEDNSDPDSRSPVHKKQYRSSDARWRKNLKQAFRILRDITCPHQSHLPVAGKNMRRDILINAMTVIQQLEDDVSYLLNMRDVRDLFHQMELKNHTAAGASETAVVPAARSRKRQPQNGVVIKRETSDTPATLTHYSGSADPELITATDSIVVTDFTDMSSMSHDHSADFDSVFSVLTSTPKRDETGAGCLMRRSKDKFAPSKKPENVRRRLNMDEADESFVPGVMAGGGDGPAFEQAVDDYLETSFTQLLHMSQGGTIYYEPAVPVQVDGSFSEGPAPEISVAYDVEIESCDPASQPLNYSIY